MERQGQAGYFMSRGNSDTDSAKRQLGLNVVHNALEAHTALDGLFAGVRESLPPSAGRASAVDTRSLRVVFVRSLITRTISSALSITGQRSGGLGYKFNQLGTAHFE